MDRLFTVVVAVFLFEMSAPMARDWSAVRHPTPTPARVYGSYANGCIAGAVPLEAQGPGFKSVRRHRHRFFGHPELRAYLHRLGRRFEAAGLPAVFIGDMSQPRGGKMKTGHRSHRIGLDADIWFTQPARVAREGDGSFPSLVDERRETIDADVLQPHHFEMLRMAADDPAVARIFVGWVIKRALCATVEGDRGWLRKIRPWYGHNRHFHVRLACPDDSPECVDQKPPPKGDGCGSEEYFSRAAIKRRKAAAKAGKTPKSNKPRRKKRPFPEACKRLIRQPDRPVSPPAEDTPR